MKRPGGRIPKRISWDRYFMSIAELVAQRSTCLRRKVGAVIVKGKHIITTGYNGAPRGLKHCLETGCLRAQLKIGPGERHELCRGIHAEQNAIIQAAIFGLNVSGATIYSTHQPCFICTKIIINANINKIVTKKPYPDKFAERMLKEAKIKVKFLR